MSLNGWLPRPRKWHFWLEKPELDIYFTFFKNNLYKIFGINRQIWLFSKLKHFICWKFFGWDSLNSNFIFFNLVCNFKIVASSWFFFQFRRSTQNNTLHRGNDDIFIYWWFNIVSFLGSEVMYLVQLSWATWNLLGDPPLSLRSPW